MFGGKTKQVYIINGFLEAGKTEFIKFTLGQEYFRTKGNTLLILCEEGEEEYPAELMKRSGTDMILIEDEENMNPQQLAAIEKSYKPDRILIEWNGMWNFKDFKMPDNWQLAQQITIIDASTFPMYYTNMKSLLAEQIRNSEMIVFNRCDNVREDLPSYKRNVKAVNPKAEIIFEDAQGEINEIFEEDLPYDLSQDELVLGTEEYGIFYLDAMDHLERYVGKLVSFQALCMTPPEFPSGFFIPGRMAMTCCAQDMAFLGYACKYAPGMMPVKDREWIMLTAEVKKEFFKDYGCEGPVLYAKEINKSREPKDAVVTFGQQA